MHGNLHLKCDWVFNGVDGCDDCGVDAFVVVVESVDSLLLVEHSTVQASGCDDFESVDALSVIVLVPLLLQPLLVSLLVDAFCVIGLMEALGGMIRMIIIKSGLYT